VEQLRFMFLVFAKKNKQIVIIVLKKNQINSSKQI